MNVAYIFLIFFGKNMKLYLNFEMDVYRNHLKSLKTI